MGNKRPASWQASVVGTADQYLGDGNHQLRGIEISGPVCARPVARGSARKVGARGRGARSCVSLCASQ